MILQKELNEIARKCQPYPVTIKPWSSSPKGETRYYINLYSQARGGEPCRTKLWFTADNPKIQVDDRYDSIGGHWHHQMKWVQREIDKFFEENEELFATRKL